MTNETAKSPERICMDRLMREGSIPVQAPGLDAALEDYRKKAMAGLTNAKLLALAEANPPPQSWYDEDHTGLYVEADTPAVVTEEPR